LAKLEVYLDGDAKVFGQGSVRAELPSIGSAPEQTGALKLVYRFGAGWKFEQTGGVTAAIESTQGGPRLFGLWLHGDGKGCQARVRFKDSTGQVFQPDGPKIDWKGWRYVTFPMQSTEEKPLTHWGGAKDGVIHYPIEWDAVFLLDNISRQPVEGEIYLSAPTLIY
jgi:hypothetical protein